MAVVETFAVLAGTIGPSNWTGIGFRVVFLGGFVFYLLRPAVSGVHVKESL